MYLLDSAFFTAPEESAAKGGITPKNSNSPDQVTMVYTIESNCPDGHLSDFTALNMPAPQIRVYQENMPNHNPHINVATNSSTDLELYYHPKSIGIGENAFAFITGEPAPPQVKVRLDQYFIHTNSPAKFKWRVALETERPERGTTDNRYRPMPKGAFTEVTVDAVEKEFVFDVADILDNEIVGGKCTFYLSLPDGKETNFYFYIRGKNPLDAKVEQYINDTVDPAFTNIFKHIAMHESKLEVEYQPKVKSFWLYNQFNAIDYKDTDTGKNRLHAGTPNRGAPDGWGVMQIDRSGNTTGIKYTTTAETWNWKTSINFAATLLPGKVGFYNTAISKYRNVYGPGGTHSTTKWCEPDNILINYQVVIFTGLEWGVAIYYNGAKGIATHKIPGYMNGFQSSLSFNENTGLWSVSDNNQHNIGDPKKAQPYGKQIANFIKKFPIIINE